MKKVTLQAFQNYGSIFENISKNETLRSELEQYGYDEQELNKGRNLYLAAQEKLDTNKIETAEEKLAYDGFSKKFETLKRTYSTDRKKAKIIFKDNEAILSVLGVKGAASIRISGILDAVDTLYKQLQASEEIRIPLRRLKITDEHIAQQLSLLEETQTAYQTYEKEKGESQQATQDKNKALFELEKWVREFYAIAKIALEDKPQLLEVIGKFVRS